MSQLLSDQPFTQLRPGLATGTPTPQGWQPISARPLLILVGVTGTGKSTTINALGDAANSCADRTFTLLPNRRTLTDQLIIGHLQAYDGQPVEPVRDRRARFEYTRRYRARYAGGMAHALTQLWVQPDTLNALLVFDGLRGENEVANAAHHLPNARFAVLDAPDMVRVQRLLGRGDIFDQVNPVSNHRGANNHGASPFTQFSSFTDLGLDTASVEDAHTIFNEAEEQALLALIRQESVTPSDLQAKLQIVITERGNYDPQITIATLRAIAPDRTLVVDTTTHQPAEIAELIWDAMLG